jgi:ADP-glucose pyrophosphorylase
MEDIIVKYNMLDAEKRKLLDAFLDFLISKNKPEADSFNRKEYAQRIQTVSQWWEQDVAYLDEIKLNYNWKVEQR